MNLVKALRGELLDCNCCAYSRSECCCDTTWPEEVTREAADHIERLTAELETERMRLAACGVVAMANTRESAEKQRQMLPEYMSASCQDVMRAVDAEMDYREQLTETRDLAEHWAILAEQRRVELGECRKDAERYQYLRNIERRECLDLTGPEAGVWCDAENEMGELLLLTEDDLDAAIDAAMGVKP